MNASTGKHALHCRQLASGKHQATVWVIDDAERPLRLVRSVDAIEPHEALHEVLSWCAENGVSLE